jgi:hypothetical protein
VPRRPRDPLVRAAGRLAGLLGPAGGRAGADADRDLAAVLARARAVDAAGRRLALARSRGWDLAAGRVRADLVRHARLAAADAAAFLARRPAAPPPAPRDVLADLRQLADEFGGLAVDLRDGGRLVARTPPLVLAGVRLGPFAVELHLSRLAGGGRPGAACFACVALAPNPASADESVTHPHVRDGRLCAGDAAAAIAAALAAGRACDAFCLVRAVLQAYNPASPYVPLDEWDGAACGDCGRTVGRDETSYCEHCGGDRCDDCTGYCEACETSCCRGCLARDEAADADLCPACAAACGDCGRTVRADDVEPATGRCPGCRAEREYEQEEAGRGEAERAVTAADAAVTGDAAAGTAAAPSSVPPQPQQERSHDEPVREPAAVGPAEGIPRAAPPAAVPAAAAA